MKQIIFLTSLFVIIACKKEKPPEEFLRHVGDITFDPALDTLNFEPCHEDQVLQYYNFSNAIQYEGEKAKIITEFEDKFQPVNQEEDGYITIRFIVNCKGKTGRFRVIGMDKNYTEKIFSKELTHQLLAITRALDGWKPGDYDGRIFDYYQYLTFKINRGKIERIMP